VGGREKGFVDGGVVVAGVVEVGVGVLMLMVGWKG
jgi:hypothetical protein